MHDRRHHRELRDGLLERQRIGRPLGEEARRVVGAREREHVRAAVARAGHADRIAHQLGRRRVARAVLGRAHEELRRQVLGEREVEERIERRLAHRVGHVADVHADEPLVLGPRHRLDEDRPARRSRRGPRIGELREQLRAPWGSARRRARSEAPGRASAARSESVEQERGVE
jgi:hypothetical protein